MTNLKKLLMSVGLALLAPLSALAGPAEDTQVRLQETRSYWYEARSNSSTMINVYYVGSGTQAVVTIDADSIASEIPYGTAATDFGSDGASGSFDTTAAAYDTIGELCDAIEALANYGCEMAGAKRDDDSVLLRDRLAVVSDNLKAAGGFDVSLDTGSTIVGTSFVPSAYIMTLGVSPKNANKRIVLKRCETSVNVIADYRVYGKSARYEENSRANSRKNVNITDTQEVWREITADDTAESYDWTPDSAVSASDGWQFAQGAHVVVRSGEGGTGVQAPANFLRCLFEER